MLVICLPLVVFLYDRQPNEVAHEEQNETSITQEVGVADMDVVADIDDQQITLLGEINQQELQLTTNDAVLVVVSPQQQPVPSSSITAQDFVIDEEVAAQKSTGADLESSKLSDEEELQWEQIWALRFVTPVKKNSFEINFNNKSRLFEATLRSKTAKDDLQSWLVKNNFSQIPDTSFLYIIAY